MLSLEPKQHSALEPPCPVHLLTIAGKWRAIETYEKANVEKYCPERSIRDHTHARFGCMVPFPRHSRNLLVRCWGTGPQGQLLEAARFKIKNPGYEPEVHEKAL